MATLVFLVMDEKCPGVVHTNHFLFSLNNDRDENPVIVMVSNVAVKNETLVRALFIWFAVLHSMITEFDKR